MHTLWVALKYHTRCNAASLNAVCVTGSAGLAEVKNAAEVAGRLVRAYGELRQVELLLHSLTTALSATAHTAAATRIINSDAFKAALHQVNSYELLRQRCLSFYWCQLRDRHPGVTRPMTPLICKAQALSATHSGGGCIRSLQTI